MKSYSSSCRHSSPSATLDLLIFVLVLGSCAFLISSSFSYIFRSLSQVLPSLLQPIVDSYGGSSILCVAVILAAASVILTVSEIPSGWRPKLLRQWSNRCGKPRCKGMKKAMEFDVQMQTEESIRRGNSATDAELWREIEELPWKGGDLGNSPEYECLRIELRKMAPANGRAVLLFRARCGCPIAKLEAWGPKKGRRKKK